MDLLDVCGSKGCLSQHTNDAFRSKLVKVAQAIGTDPDYLATVIAFETAGSFSPSARNPYSSATGLIQFIGPTARKLGTSTEALSQMGATQQLDYVYRYFQGLFKGPYPTLANLYLTVFSPQFRNRPLSAVAYSAPSPEYEQNKGFDRAGRGYFTVGDIVAPVQGIYNAAQRRPRVSAGNFLPTVVALAAVGVAGIYAYAYRDDITKIIKG